jgi:hypothetical protein
LHSLHQVLLSLWLGGILVLGAIAAPGVFGAAKAAGHTQRGMPLYTFAGVAMGDVFERFAAMIMVVGLLLAVVGVAYGQLAGVCRRRTIARAVVVVVAWGLTAWMAFGVFPQMDTARELKNMALFDSLHDLSSNVFKVQALLLLGVAAISACPFMNRTSQASATNDRTSSRDAAKPVVNAAPQA